MPTEYEQRKYRIRYLDGKEEIVMAHQMYTAGDGTVTLKKAPGDNIGNTVFMATPSSGVTVTQFGHIV